MLCQFEGIGVRGTMVIEVLGDTLQLPAIKADWQRLVESSPNATLYSTYEWLSTWLRCLGQSKQLAVLVARESGRVAGIGPFIINRREGLREATLMGGRVSDYKDILVDPSVDRQTVISEMLEKLLSLRHVDFVHCSSLAEHPFGAVSSSPTSAAIHREYRLLHPIVDEHDVAVVLPIEGTLDSFWRKLGRGYRENCHRQINRIRKLGSGYAYYYPASVSEARRYVDVMVQQKVDRWRHTKHEPTLIEQPAVRHFYAEVAEALFAAGWLRVPVLMINGQPAAVDMGAIFGGRYFSCQHSFDEAFATYSVGRLLNLHLVEQAYAQGLREVDFGLGAEPYKFDFKPQSRPLYSLSLYKTGLRGLAAQRWHQTIRPRLEQATQSQRFIQPARLWLKSHRT
jgi:CelD/BcsL family acetyltransferase involved in cellulose biosynthesis